jgi:hypothetical protein
MFLMLYYLSIHIYTIPRFDDGRHMHMPLYIPLFDIVLLSLGQVNPCLVFVQHLTGVESRSRVSCPTDSCILHHGDTSRISRYCSARRPSLSLYNIYRSIRSMPFLLPALTSLFSDSMVLYLHHVGLYAAHVTAATATVVVAASTVATTQQQENNSINSIYSGENENDTTATDDSSPLAAFYYQVGYLPFLAGLRIALLMLPLFFHSYTGTALKCATFYRVLYSTSLILLLFQMLALAVMDPKSLQALVILSGSNGSTSGSVLDSGKNTPQVLHEQQLHELQRIWYMLLFSTMSNICHVVLFWHVRSTAQSPHYASSFYFAIRSSATSSAEAAAYRATANSINTGLYGNHVAAVNEFVVDLRLRLNRAKKEWTKRLEDFVNHGSPSEETSNNSSNITLKNHPLTPFRVLLSLFAYEDVLQNGKLEAVYQVDGGQSMTFYIPQLLSFLLHGAGDSLQSSSALEEWILEKCRTNVYFAHKCFWFLRAWCLEQVIIMPPQPPSSKGYDLATSLSGGATTATSLSSLCYSTTPSRKNNNDTATSSRSKSDSVLQVSEDRTNMQQQSSLPPLLPPYLDQPAPSPTSTDSWDDNSNDDGGDGGIFAGTTSGISTDLMASRNSAAQRRTRCPSPLPPISGKFSNNATPGTSMLSAAVLATPSSTLRTTASSVLSTTLHDCLASPKTAAGGGARMITSTSNSNLGAMMADKFLPEERAMIERLMLRVKECGQESAHLLQYGHHATTHPYSDTVNVSPSKHHAKNAESSTIHLCSSSSEDEDSYITATQEDYDTTDDEYEDLISPTCPDKSDTATATVCKLLSASLSYASPDASLFARVQTMAIAAGQIPINPITQEPSPRHLACLAAGQRKYGFLPWSQVMEGRQKQPLKRIGQRETQDFDQTPRFVDSLLHLAESLFRIPREQRKAELLRQLRILECDFLPSNAIYLPISQNVRHTVWRIVPEESIPLNTKERVPCLLALEVVNHDATKENSTRGTSSKRRDGNAWRNILGHIGQHRSVHDVKPQTSPLSSPWAVASTAGSKSPQMEQAALSSSWSPPQKSFQHMESASIDVSIGATGIRGAVAGNGNISITKSNSESVGMSEADVVNQWRFKIRQPLRHVSLIDKVTGGLDKVHKVLRTTSAGGVATVAGTLQRSTSDELQNLVSTMTGERLEQLGGEKPPTAARLATISLSSDAFMKEPGQGNQIISDDECIWQMEEQQIGVSSLNLSRASSVGSIVSMGQWGSPTPMESPPPFNNVDRRSIDGIGQQNVRRRFDRESNEQRNGGNISLRYGSDHEDDQAEDDLVQQNWLSNSGGWGRSSSMDNVSGHPLSPVPATRKRNKPPPVVFRESWNNKEERVRQNSIYGQHPGWKLLPILVKAQDDLRQEQLASQLIYRMASILANENVPVWLCPYEIIALTDTGGIIEAIPDTISES